MTHSDGRGLPLSVGDLVVAPYCSSMTRLARVTKLCPKKVQVAGEPGQEYSKGCSGQYYSKDLFLLESASK